MLGALFALAAMTFVQPCNAEIQVDLSKLSHGTMMGIDIPGGPYYIVRRSAEEQKILINRYGQDNLRSGHTNFMLIKAESPDSDCFLSHVAKGDNEYARHPIQRIGGFMDPCSCAWFDLTGRRQSECCSESDLEVAPHKFLHDEVVVIGG